MSLDLLLGGPVGTTLGWTLIHFLWQATAVALILASVQVLWSGASSNARYLCAVAALGVVLVLPVLTFSHLWSDVRAGSSPVVTAIEGGGAWSFTIEEESSPTPAVGALETRISAGLPWLVGLWLLGVSLLGLRLVIRTLSTSRLTRDHLSEVEGSWHRALARLCRKLAMRRSVSIYESALVEVPTVVGWLEPVILVPTSVFTGLTYLQIEMILAHELAHIRRHDALVNFLQSVVETVLFFHPAVWWISGRVRIEREFCCDDMAVAVCGDRVAYARALAFLEESRATAPANTLAATGGSLLERIRRIAGVEERDRKAPPVAALVLLLALGSATAWALSAPGTDDEPDLEVEVTESGRWYVSPPVPPAPPAAPSAPDCDLPEAPPTPGVVFHAPPAPPAPPSPPAPPAPWEDAEWMFDEELRLAELERLLEGVRLPEPAEAPVPPEPVFPSYPAAPEPPLAPAPPRFTSLAPPAAHSVVVRGKRLNHTDRTIGDDLSTEDLIALRAVGVDAAYLKELRSLGFGDLTIGEAAAMRAVGLTAEYARQMRQVFGDDLSARDLAQLKGLGVTAPWVEEMRRRSDETITREDAIRLRGVGVSPEWIATMTKALDAALSLEQAVQLRGVGVSEEYVKGLAARGIEVTRTEDLIHLRAVGVTPRFIDQMRDAGLTNLSPSDLAGLRGVGVTPEYVESLRDAGLRNLTVDKLIRLRAVGVDADFVREMME